MYNLCCLKRKIPETQSLGPQIFAKQDKPFLPFSSLPFPSTIAPSPCPNLRLPPHSKITITHPSVVNTQCNTVPPLLHPRIPCLSTNSPQTSWVAQALPSRAKQPQVSYTLTAYHLPPTTYRAAALCLRLPSLAQSFCCVCV